MKYILLFLVISCAFMGSVSFGQKFSDAIEDNSFFIEEAYNQEDYVVQHISTGLYNRKSKDFGYSFTQEWPAFGIKHQLSYSIPYFWQNVSGKNGIGDIMLNYRFQAMGHDEWAAFSPRFSLILPTGKEEDGLGSGVVGFQVNLPFSKRLANEFILHFNLGTTILPGVKNTDIFGKEQKNTLTSFFTGGSLIWLLNSNINIMAEYLVNINQVFDENNEKSNITSQVICPGVRYAIDISDLQIVPGLAFPITIQNSESNTDLFFYLSFEHPF